MRHTAILPDCQVVALQLNEHERCKTVASPLASVPPARPRGAPPALAVSLHPSHDSQLSFPFQGLAAHSSPSQLIPTGSRVSARLEEMARRRAKRVRVRKGKCSERMGMKRYLRAVLQHHSLATVMSHVHYVHAHSLPHRSYVATSKERMKPARFFLPHPQSTEGGSLFSRTEYRSERFLMFTYK